MQNYKETVVYTDTGPKLIVEVSNDYEDFTCYNNYPQSCAKCPIGWRRRCTVPIEVQRVSNEDRPENCPLALVVNVLKD